MRLGFVAAVWCLAICTSDAQQPGSGIQAQILQAQSLVEQCDFGEALKVVRATAAAATVGAPMADADRVQLAFALSVVARRAGDVGIALEQAETLVGMLQQELPTDLAFARLQRGLAYAAAGDFAKADLDLAEAERRLAPASNEPNLDGITVLDELSRVAELRGQSTAALVYVVRAERATLVRKEPVKHLWFLVRLAGLKREAADFAGAEAALAETDKMILAAGLSQALSNIATVLRLRDIERVRLLIVQGKFGEAQTVIDRVAREIGDKPVGCQRDLQTQLVIQKALMDGYARRMPEAREGFRRARELAVALGGFSSSGEGDMRLNLAQIESFARNTVAAGAEYDAALKSYRIAHGGIDTYKEVIVLSEHAIFLARSHNGAGALKLAQEAKRIANLPNVSSPQTKANASRAMAFALKASGRLDEAAGEAGDALDAFVKIRGANSHELTPLLVDAGEGDLLRKRPAEAEARLRTALSLQIKAGFDTVLQSGLTQSLLAEALAAQGRGIDALSVSDKAVAVVARRRAEGSGAREQGAVEEARVGRSLLERDLRLLLGGAGLPPRRDVPTVERALRDVQLANLTTTELAITQLSDQFLRHPTLGQLIGRLRAAREEVALLEDRYESILKLGADAASSEALKASLDAARSRLADIGKELAQSGANFLDLSSPAPVTLAEAQSELSAGQAILAVLVGESELTLVVVTRDNAMARQIAITRQAVADLVARARPVDPLKPFDTAAGYAIFQRLIAPVQDLLPGQDGTLLYIPDGDLTGFPLGAALTAPADMLANRNGHDALPWLAKRYAIAVLPSVNTLAVLRGHERGIRAPQPFIGIGDPVLSPGGGADRSSPTEGPPVLIDWTSGQRLMDPSALRKLGSLGGAGSELRDMQKALASKTSPGRTLLGTNATESSVRREKLDQYRVIAFATHGLLAGELSGTNEPGLVLTPPKVASPADDGYLSASEIASSFHLNADLVILSACNTARGDGREGAPALSGLARAFFYAGARSLVVSHWKVANSAAETLSVGMIEAIAAGVPPAEAARQAQHKEMTAELYSGHPYYWAPFSYIGVP